MDLRSLSEEAPESQWRMPARDKVGAEQLQQVPSLGHCPDGVVRLAPPAPVGPTHAVAAATDSVVCGIGTDELEVLNHDGEAASIVEKFPGCFAAVLAHGSLARGRGWPATRARRISTRRLHGHSSNRWAIPGRGLDVAPRCAGSPGSERSRRRRALGAGHRGLEPNVLLTAGRSRNVTADTIQTSRPAGRPGGTSRAARC